MRNSSQNPRNDQMAEPQAFHNDQIFNAAEHHQTQLRRLIEDFFASSGVSGPTSNLHNLLHDFLLNDDENYPNSRQFINTTVIETTRTMQFIAALHERWTTYETYLPQPASEQQAA